MKIHFLSHYSKKSITLTPLAAKLRAFAACVLVGLGCTSVPAEEYPNRVLRIVQPFPPGGSTDVLARGLALKLSEYLGQSVIVESRPGANGIIGAQSVARSAPDGYTMLLTTGSHTANPHVAKNLPYDALKDFAPISQLAASYGLALITNLPVKSVAELTALAKQRSLSYGMSGVGNLTHVAGKLFEARIGASMVAVPYNTPALIPDTISGTVDMTFNSMITAVPLVTSGQLKALAITGDRRSPGLPDTPTMTEAGVKDYVLTGYFGILFPAGTPRERVERIHRETARALATPELRRVIEDNGLYPVGSSPDEFARYLAQDFANQGRLMDELGLRPK
jgi:tripartite-type tricarboxylate transporter receptor subunit TctC